MNAKEFEDQWFKKIVRPLGTHYQIPIKDYLVTAALYEWEDGNTKFAIRALDYSTENKQWFTINIAPDEFELCMSDFEVVSHERQSLL